MKPIVLITGATSGIGKACAKILAKKYNLILCGRRKHLLESLKNELLSKTEIHTLCFDVRNKSDVFHHIENLPKDWKKIYGLINNAGNAHGLDTIQDGNIDDWEAMIDINFKGLLYVTKVILPLMLSEKKGHIINIGSIAGVDVYTKGNVYCASKAAVDTLSKAMRLDLVEHNIKVSEVKPGLVETEFSMVRFKGNEVKSKTVYQGFTPLNAEDVADAVNYIITRPSHVNIADMLILPSAQANSTTVIKKII